MRGEQWSVPSFAGTGLRGEAIQAILTEERKCSARKENAMPVEIRLEGSSEHCSMVPLAVIGYCLTRSQVLQPVWSGLKLKMKTYEHQPSEKLQDVLVAIMAGCRSLAQVNTRLRPERMLAQAWQRQQFAEQSSLSRTLEALDSTHLEHLRAGNVHLVRQHGQLRQHDWRQFVMLDIDPTSLLTSKHAEGSRKGWVSGKKTSIVGMSSASPWPATMKTCSRSPIRATATAMSTANQPCSACCKRGRGRQSNDARSSSAVMPGRGPMPT